MTDPVVTCPCCGAPVERPWVWDVSTGRLATQFGTTKALGPKESLLLDALVRVNGRVLSHSACIEAMYRPCEEPDDIENALKVRVCTLNRELRKIGVKIVNEFARGYRLALPSRLEAAPC